MDKLRKIDSLSQPPALFFKKNYRYSSILGGLLTIAIGTMSAALMLYFTIKVFSRSNVFSVESKEYRESQELDLSDYNFPLQVTNNLGKPYPKTEAERLFTPVLTYFYTIEDGSTVQILEEYVLEPCTVAHLGSKAYLFEDIANLEEYYCIPLEFSLKLFGIYGRIKKYSATFTTIRMCTNGKYNKTNCYSEEHIKSRMANFYVNLVYVDYNVQNSNIAQPGVAYAKTDRVQVGMHFFKRLFYELTIVEYITDFGYIFPDEQTERFFTVSNYNLIPDLRVQDIFMASTFCIGRNKKTFVRSFEKFQQVLSNIGGALKALTILGTLTLKLAYGQYYFWELSEELHQTNSKDAKNLSRFASKISDNSLAECKIKADSPGNKPKMNWKMNLKLLMGCGKTKQSKNLANYFSKVKQILSVDTILRTFVQFNTLKNLLMSREGVTVLESIGHFETKPLKLEDAKQKLTRKRRDFIENRLFELLID